MKKLSMDKLVNTVINERKAKGLTQVQLAEATGINRAMIGRLENSDYIPSIDQLQRLGENRICLSKKRKLLKIWYWIRSIVLR